MFGKLKPKSILLKWRGKFIFFNKYLNYFCFNSSEEDVGARRTNYRHHSVGRDYSDDYDDDYQYDDDEYDYEQKVIDPDDWMADVYYDPDEDFGINKLHDSKQNMR